MEILKYAFVTALMAMPVLIFLRSLMPDSLAWYQSASAGVVAAMLAGHWLRGIQKA